MFVPFRVDAVIVFTFAIVSYRGNPNVFIIFHEFASREEKTRVAKGCEIRILLVPSAKVTPDVVLTIIDWGDDRYPSESRIVTFRPGGL
jgi:hypothetical protein